MDYGLRIADYEFKLQVSVNCLYFPSISAFVVGVCDGGIYKAGIQFYSNRLFLCLENAS